MRPKIGVGSDRGNEREAREVREARRSPEQAARTALHLATSPEVEGVSGKLFADSKEVAIGGQALEPGLKERLWLESVRSTGITVG